MGIGIGGLYTAAQVLRRGQIEIHQHFIEQIYDHGVVLVKIDKILEYPKIDGQDSGAEGVTNLNVLRRTKVHGPVSRIGRGKLE